MYKCVGVTKGTRSKILKRNANFVMPTAFHKLYSFFLTCYMTSIYMYKCVGGRYDECKS